MILKQRISIILNFNFIPFGELMILFLVFTVLQLCQSIPIFVVTLGACIWRHCKNHVSFPLLCSRLNAFRFVLRGQSGGVRPQLLFSCWSLDVTQHITNALRDLLRDRNSQWKVFQHYTGTRVFTFQTEKYNFKTHVSLWPVKTGA